MEYDEDGILHMLFGYWLCWFANWIINLHNIVITRWAKWLNVRACIRGTESQCGVFIDLNRKLHVRIRMKTVHGYCFGLHAIQHFQVNPYSGVRVCVCVLWWRDHAWGYFYRIHPLPPPKRFRVILAAAFLVNFIHFDCDFIFCFRFRCSQHWLCCHFSFHSSFIRRFVLHSLLWLLLPLLLMFVFLLSHFVD